MAEIGQEIIGGKIKIEPCRYSGVTSCDYCPYRGICQFDQLFENNRYRYMKKKKSEEVLEELRSKAQQGGKEDEHA
jgi:ATP-dependent helicase/nuclease subunit B